MSDGTEIEWTDATWNVVNGCSVVSPGCTNCYAMRLAGTRMKHHPSRAGLTRDSKAGPVWTGEVRFNDKVLLNPLRWRRPRKIFVCAHGDLFHNSVPDEWIDRVFAVMALADQHVFQVLTKRPERMRAYLQSRDTSKLGDPITDAAFMMNCAVRGYRGSGGAATWPLPNVWLGVSVEDQARAVERIPILLDTPAAVHWLSMEPLLGPVRFGEYLPNPLWNDLPSWKQPELDWVVLGGESGPSARPMHPDWARSVRDQCAAAGIPFLFKQWGEWAPGLCGVDGDRGGLASFPDHPGQEFGGRPTHWWDDTHSFSRPPGPISVQIGKKAAGRVLDGAQHDGYPA